jgi:hypothetical protein
VGLSNQNINSTSAIKELKDLTISWFMAWTSKPRAFICQLLTTPERMNPLKSKFFSAVACPKTGLVEFSHPINQRLLHAWCHFRLPLLIINMRRKEVLVRPLGSGVHANEEPLLRSAFLAAPKGGI